MKWPIGMVRTVCAMLISLSALPAGADGVIPRFIDMNPSLFSPLSWRDHPPGTLNGWLGRGSGLNRDGSHSVRPGISQDPAMRATVDQLLPLPKKFQFSGQSIRLPRRIAVLPATDAVDEKRAAGVIASMLQRSGFRAATVAGRAGLALRLRQVPGFSPEGYRLTITATGGVVEASSHSGLLYGGISFWQLATAGDGTMLLGTLTDHPSFGWRGLMLDSARHFQSPRFVRQLIDWMAAHKLNRLHWHLVDDQGWRIEIKKYPKLIETAAWRTPAVATGVPPPPRTGGFYSQAQIKELVAYAAARGIEIVPEIEMPGHALSAIRAYPEVGMGIAVPAGAESNWGVFPWLYNTDEPTITFLTDILDEVMALFPSRYIHIGGDEAVKDQWKASPATQARMKALGLADESALQSWFISRIGQHLQQKGRILIGWDEILQGGIPPNAAITSWRGIEGAITAARAGHDAVLSPAPALYLDHVQSASPSEPPGRGGVVSLTSVRGFNPLPSTLSPDEQKHILGLQGNLWTEHVRTEARASWMLFPRGSAIAEIGWNGASKEPVLAFAKRLQRQLIRLEPFGLNAADSAFRPELALSVARGKMRATLGNEIGAPIRYSLGGHAPTSKSAIYTGPIRVVSPVTIRARSFLNNRALPGKLVRAVNPAAAGWRDSRELKTCSGKVDLVLEDDSPVAERRAAFLIDILQPCWIYHNAQLRSGARLILDVGQIPFNFQVGAEREAIRFRPPRSPGGEFEFRAPGCSGELIGTASLAKAWTNPGITRLETELHLPPTLPEGSYDLCLTYTANGPDPLWAVKSLDLIVAR